MKIMEQDVAGETHTRLRLDQIRELAVDIPEWQVGESGISREFVLENFRQAIQFVDRVADMAEELDHHPDIAISFNKVRLALSTHAAGGPTLKDFLLAKKIDFVERK